MIIYFITIQQLQLFKSSVYTDRQQQKFTKDKGNGLFSSENIKRGDKILLENYSFLQRIDDLKNFLEITDKDLDISNISIDKIKELEKIQKFEKESNIYNLVDAWESKFGFKSLLGIILTNSISIDFEGLFGALFDKACMINHCCISNVEWTFIQESNMLSVYATKDINKDEELVANQIGEFYSKNEMIEKIAKRYNNSFVCQCNRCKEDNPKFDNLRIKLREIDDSVLIIGKQDAQEAINLVQEMIRIQKIIGIDNQNTLFRNQNDLITQNLKKGKFNKKFIRNIIEKLLNILFEMEGNESFNQKSQKSMIKNIPENQKEYEKIIFRIDNEKIIFRIDNEK